MQQKSLFILLIYKSCHSGPSLKRLLGHASAASISLNGETLNSPKLVTKLKIKFHI